jgi:hypothetical protein
MHFSLPTFLIRFFFSNVDGIIDLKHLGLWWYRSKSFINYKPLFTIGNPHFHKYTRKCFTIQTYANIENKCFTWLLIVSYISILNCITDMGRSGQVLFSYTAIGISTFDFPFGLLFFYMYIPLSRLCTF